MKKVRKVSEESNGRAAKEKDTRVMKGKGERWRGWRE